MGCAGSHRFNFYTCVLCVFTRAKRDAAANYETAVATRGPIEEVVAALGKVRPPAYVDIGAQASGRLNRIPVCVGQAVAVGDDAHIDASHMFFD